MTGTAFSESQLSCLSCHMQDPVALLGYPIGGDSISVTAGVVSRIEVYPAFLLVLCGMPTLPGLLSMLRMVVLSSCFERICKTIFERQGAHPFKQDWP